MLAIDQSLTSTGVAYRDHDGDIMIDRIVPKRLGSPRLHMVAEAIKEIVVYQRPELMAIEGYAYSAGAKRGGVTGRPFELGELGGVLKLIAYQYGVPLVTLTTGSMKRVMTGKGNTKGKEEVVRGVEEMLGLEVTQNDEADAVGLLVTAEAIYFKYGPEVALERAKGVKVREFESGVSKKMASLLY